MLRVAPPPRGCGTFVISLAVGIPAIAMGIFVLMLFAIYMASNSENKPATAIVVPTETAAEQVETAGPTEASEKNSTTNTPMPTLPLHSREISDFPEECVVNLNVTPLVATKLMDGKVNIWTPDQRKLAGEYGYLLASSTLVNASTATESFKIRDENGDFVGVGLGSPLYPSEWRMLKNNGWVAPEKNQRYGWTIRTLQGLLMDGCSDALVYYTPRFGRYTPG